MYSLLVSVGVGVLVAGVMVAEVEEDKQLPYTYVESLWHLIQICFVYII